MNIESIANTKVFNSNYLGMEQDKFSYLHREIQKLARSNLAYLEVINGSIQCQQSQTVTETKREIQEVKKIFSNLLSELAQEDPKKALNIIETFQLSSWGQQYYPELQDLHTMYIKAVADELEFIFRRLFALLELRDIESYIRSEKSEVTKLFDVMRNIINDLSIEFFNFDVEDDDLKLKKMALMLKRMIKIEKVCFNNSNFIGLMTIDAFFSRPFIFTNDLWKTITVNEDIVTIKKNLDKEVQLLLKPTVLEMKKKFDSDPKTLVPLVHLLDTLFYKFIYIKHSQDQLENCQKFLDTLLQKKVEVEQEPFSKQFEFCLSLRRMRMKIEEIKKAPSQLEDLMKQLYEMTRFVKDGKLSSYGENILAQKALSKEKQEELDNNHYQHFEDMKILISLFVTKIESLNSGIEKSI